MIVVTIQQLNYILIIFSGTKATLKILFFQKNLSNALAVTSR